LFSDVHRVIHEVLADSKPEDTVTVEELEGAIAKDTWDSLDVVLGKPNIRDLLAGVLAALVDPICCKCGAEFAPEARFCHICANERQIVEVPFSLTAPDGTTAGLIVEFLQNCIKSEKFSPRTAYKAEMLIKTFERAARLKTDRGRTQRIKGILEAPISITESDSKQEQIGLKYVEEGNFLQKLLEGSRVEHLQSNVKMVVNPIRQSSCEVDSVYRVIGEKRIVVVESKGHPLVSRAQLYQAYETYTARVPLDWHVDVVAVLMNTNPDEDLRIKGITTVIELVLVGFDDSVFGEITPSLAALYPARRYRWHIKRAAAIPAAEHLLEGTEPEQEEAEPVEHGEEQHVAEGPTIAE
jgi:hypothetical protein